MKKTLLFCSLMLTALCFVGCNKFSSQKELTMPESFIVEIDNYTIFPTEGMGDYGLTYNYKGRNIHVQIYYRQVGIAVVLVDEGGNREDIAFIYDCEDDFSEDPQAVRQVEVTQYDFDGDNIDELVVATRIANVSYPSAVDIYVYRLKDGKQWEISAPETWWNPMIHLVLNHVKVDANHYGYTYDWVYEKGQFIDRGKY